MGIELVRFDMSEYMERHTVSRLIGAPPGYVGFDQGGLLTEAVTKNPHSVVLLDEIEKAHPEVFNLLLQVMDHGTLTDNNGRKADFRNVILVMTTNAGAEDISRRTIGFVEQDHSTDGLEAINRMFTPEFRNRLDAIIQFEPLNTDVILTVVDKFLTELQHQLDEKKVTLDVDEDARRVAGRARLRRQDGRAPHGARHPGEHQEAAGRGHGAVRRTVRRATARCEEKEHPAVASDSLVLKRGVEEEVETERATAPVIEKRRRVIAVAPRRACAAGSRLFARAVGDATLGQVVGRQFHLDLVAGEDADVVLAHLAGDMGGHDVTVLQLRRGTSCWEACRSLPHPFRSGLLSPFGSGAAQVF